MARKYYVALALCLFFMSFGCQCYGALQFGFYEGKCNGEGVENIVGGVVKSLINQDRSIVAALLRMQFHDCFVNMNFDIRRDFYVETHADTHCISGSHYAGLTAIGCDASILLDGDNSEKTAGPNASVRGFDVIDIVKDALEAKCSGVVSCADIIVMATRDSVALSGGRRYAVQTGRQDGKVSLASKVNLPSSSISVSAAANMFADKNLTARDMVILLGGHTVGVTHCSFIKDRLYNSRNSSSQPDNTMDLTLQSKLRTTCPQTTDSDNFEVNLDQNSNSTLTVDNSYYQELLAGKAVLQIDQRLASDSLTKAMVTNAASATDFATKFGQAMVKLGALAGSRDGEIRKSCRVVNKHTTENKDTNQKKQTSAENGGGTNLHKRHFFWWF